MNVYQRVAGVGSTIDNMREYLLVLYAQAYDAIDKHFMLGGEIEYKHSQQEIARISKHFDQMVMIARKTGDHKVERILKKLKSATIQHMKGKLSAKQFVKVLRQIMREYGIPTAEMKRIEDRINRIEAEIKARERVAATRKGQKLRNVFSQLDQFTESLYGRHPARRIPPRPQRQQQNVFGALDRFTAKLFAPQAPPRKKATPRQPAKNPFAALDNLFDKLTKPRRRK